MKDELDDFFTYVSNAGFFWPGGNWGTPRRFRRYLERLFSGVEIKGKHVLDVGAGNGVFSAYLALRGAGSVCALEPEQAGSQVNMTLKFQKMLRSLGLSNVALHTKTLQEIVPPTSAFDLVLLHNCINHFDEDACAQLHCLPEAQEVYSEVFRSLNRITKIGGQVILADCSRNNCFDVLGFTSPLCPSIDWKVHQPPELWLKLAEKQGFECHSVRWTTLSHLGNWSQSFLANRVAAFFLLGHFALILRKGRSID